MKAQATPIFMKKELEAMIKLLKNANVYAPAPLGKKDILVEGEKILLMEDKIPGYEGLPGVETYDLEGKILAPGYIDIHTHITGGGGEQGDQQHRGERVGPGQPVFIKDSPSLEQPQQPQRRPEQGREEER